MAEFTLTNHAIDRALDMALDPDTIRDIILHPQLRRPDRNPAHGEGWFHISGDLCAVVTGDSGELVVKTFLPANKAAWDREAALPPSHGRDPSRYTE